MICGEGFEIWLDLRDRGVVTEEIEVVGLDWNKRRIRLNSKDFVIFFEISEKRNE